MIKRIISIGLVVIMSLSFAACGDDEKKEKTPEKEYTYNAYIETELDNWNPHIADNNSANILKYCEMGLVDAYCDDEGKVKWMYEMAEDITDITADFKDKEKYEIGNEETGRVWQIKLNKNACFEDGTPINADTYMESMKIVLDSEKKNSGAYIYYDEDKSDIAIYNAKNYYNNDKAGQAIYSSLEELGYKNVEEALTNGVKEEEVFIDFKKAFGMDVDEDNLICYKDEVPFKDIEGKLGVAGASITAKAVYDKYFSKGSKYEAYVAKYIYVPSGTYKEESFDNVGLVKVDEYTLNYITKNFVTKGYFFLGMRNNWIVNLDVYAKSIVGEGDNKYLTYATSMGTYMAYGPYKLTKATGSKFELVKNDKWYGYNDGNHKEQFETTNITIDYIPSYDERMKMFLNGELSEITVTASDIEKYDKEDKIYVVDESYTYRWIFATEKDKLIAIEKELNDGTNKRILSYKDFRKALSLAMDRERFCKEGTDGFGATGYLLSNAYLIENLDGFEVYRNVEGAYKCDKLFDTTAANELFASVYDEAVLKGDYTEGQKIEIRCMVSSEDKLSENDKKQQDLLNEMVKSAVVGTGFEGNISIVFESGEKNRYEKCANGQYEMIRGSWGGAELYPQLAIGCYTDAAIAGGYVHEQCGWNPAYAILNIPLDSDLSDDGIDDISNKTYTQWTKEISSTGTYKRDVLMRQKVVSALEQGVIEQYQCIPWGNNRTVRFLSDKVNYGCSKYNVITDFGGLRFMTYNYDNKEWEKNN